MDRCMSDETIVYAPTALRLSADKLNSLRRSKLLFWEPCLTAALCNDTTEQERTIKWKITVPDTTS